LQKKIVMNHLKVMPLVMVSPGQKVKVISLAGGRGPGPFIIAVKETRLAIGFGMARKIMVRQS
jgi:ferrous iron transport protein A